MLETLIPTRYFFPFVQRVPSIRYIVPFVSTLPIHLILPLFRFNASILFMYFFLSFQAVDVVASFHSCLYNPFVDMFVLFQFVNSSISFATFFLWFQQFPPWVTSFLSFQLLPSVCCQVVHFATSVLTFNLSLPISYCFPFVSPLTVRLFLELFRCKSFLSFVEILPSFRFNSSLPSGTSFRFNSFLSFVLPSFRFNPFLFVASFRSFQLSAFIRSFLPFVSTLKSHSLLLPFVSNRSFCCVSPYVSPL